MIELKDKIKITSSGSSALGEKGKVADAISALINLGYPAARADKAIQTALSKSPTEPALAELITQALRHI
jgi:Holliday junction resolvasome RuvABC DNA-binding subunit